MQLGEIATKEDLLALREYITALLQQVGAPVAGPHEYLTIEQVAAEQHVDKRTVKKWIEAGKYDRKGHTITLYALEFTPGHYRVPRAALVAYGEGKAFDSRTLATVPAPTQAPPMRALAS